MFTYRDLSLLFINGNVNRYLATNCRVAITNILADNMKLPVCFNTVDLTR